MRRLTLSIIHLAILLTAILGMPASAVVYFPGPAPVADAKGKPTTGTVYTDGPLYLGVGQTADFGAIGPDPLNPWSYDEDYKSDPMQNPDVIATRWSVKKDSGTYTQFSTSPAVSAYPFASTGIYTIKLDVDDSPGRANDRQPYYPYPLKVATNTITVFAVAVDIDTDVDESIEMNSPGKVISAVGNLVPTTLAYSPPTGISGLYIALVPSQTGRIRVWKTATKDPGSEFVLDQAYPISGGIPSTVYVEGLTPGEVDLQMVIKRGPTTPVLASETVRYTVQCAPPSLPTVIDDGEFTSSGAQLHASWHATGEAAVVDYVYTISTSETDPAAGNLIDASPGHALMWKHVGTATSDTTTGLTLAPGQTYFFHVKAQDAVGNWSGIGVSDGIQLRSTGLLRDVLAGPDNYEAPVTITDVVISTGPDDFPFADSSGYYRTLYVQQQSDGQTYGLRVNVDAADTLPANLTRGNIVDVVGYIQGADSGVRYLDASTSLGGGFAVKRLAAEPAPSGQPQAAIAVGGHDLLDASGSPSPNALGPNAPAVPEGMYAPYNVGTLVKVHGYVREVNAASQYIILDDGSIPKLANTPAGIKIDWCWTGDTMSNVPQVGDELDVIGIADCTCSSSSRHRVIHIRGSEDWDCARTHYTVVDINGAKAAVDGTRILLFNCLARTGSADFSDGFYVEDASGYCIKVIGWTGNVPRITMVHVAGAVAHVNGETVVSARVLEDAGMVTASASMPAAPPLLENDVVTPAEVALRNDLLGRFIAVSGDLGEVFSDGKRFSMTEDGLSPLMISSAGSGANMPVLPSGQIIGVTGILALDQTGGKYVRVWDAGAVSVLGGETRWPPSQDGILTDPLGHLPPDGCSSGTYSTSLGAAGNGYTYVNEIGIMQCTCPVPSVDPAGHGGSEAFSHAYPHGYDYPFEPDYFEVHHYAEQHRILTGASPGRSTITIDRPDVSGLYGFSRIHAVEPSHKSMALDNAVDTTRWPSGKWILKCNTKFMQQHYACYICTYDTPHAYDYAESSVVFNVDNLEVKQWPDPTQPRIFYYDGQGTIDILAEPPFGIDLPQHPPFELSDGVTENLGTTWKVEIFKADGSRDSDCMGTASGQGFGSISSCIWDGMLGDDQALAGFYCYRISAEHQEKPWHDVCSGLDYSSPSHGCNCGLPFGLCVASRPTDTDCDTSGHLSVTVDQPVVKTLTDDSVTIELSYYLNDVDGVVPEQAKVVVYDLDGKRIAEKPGTTLLGSQSSGAGKNTLTFTFMNSPDLGGSLVFVVVAQEGLRPNEFFLLDKHGRQLKALECAAVLDLAASVTLEIQGRYKSTFISYNPAATDAGQALLGGPKVLNHFRARLPDIALPSGCEMHFEYTAIDAGGVVHYYQDVVPYTGGWVEPDLAVDMSHLTPDRKTVLWVELRSRRGVVLAKGDFEMICITRPSWMVGYLIADGVDISGDPLQLQLWDNPIIYKWSHSYDNAAASGESPTKEVLKGVGAVFSGFEYEGEFNSSTGEVKAKLVGLMDCSPSLFKPWDKEEWKKITTNEPCRPGAKASYCSMRRSFESDLSYGLAYEWYTEVDKEACSFRPISSQLGLQGSAGVTWTKTVVAPCLAGLFGVVFEVSFDLTGNLSADLQAMGHVNPLGLGLDFGAELDVSVGAGRKDCIGVFAGAELGANVNLLSYNNAFPYGAGWAGLSGDVYLRAYLEASLISTTRLWERTFWAAQWDGLGYQSAPLVAASTGDKRPYLRNGEPYSVYQAAESTLPTSRFRVSSETSNQITALVAADQDQLLTSNISNAAYPSVASSGNTVLVVDSEDDPLNQAGVPETDIYAVMRNADSWGEKVNVSDNGVQDLTPVSVMAGATPIAAWVTTPNYVYGTAAELKACMEIAYGVFDGSSWSTHILTSNSVMDCDPILVTGADGSVNLVWLRSMDNSKPLLPNDQTNTDTVGNTNVMVSRWNWSTSEFTEPVELLSGLTDSVMDLSYARDAAQNEYLAWTRYTGTSVSDTTADLEIRAVYRPSGLAWCVPEVIAQNAVLNSVVAGSSEATLYFTSLADGVDGSHCVVARDFDGNGWTAPQTQFTGNLPLHTNFVHTEDGRYCVWVDTDEKSVGLYYAWRDATTGNWTERQRLDTAIRPGQPAIAYSNGDIQVVYVSRRAEKLSGVKVYVNDLRLLEHALGPDLWVTSSEISLDTANSAVSAVVHLSGEGTAANVPVKLYDGVPSAQDTNLIGTATISLFAGQSVTATVPWVRPNDGSRHDVTVVVDPLNAISETNEDNNMASAVLAHMHVEADDPVVSSYGAEQVVIGVVLKNTGSITATNVPYEVRMDDENGALIAQGRAPLILPGGSYQDTVTWNVSSIPAGNHSVCLVVKDPDGWEGVSDTVDTIAASEIEVLPDLMLSKPWAVESVEGADYGRQARLTVKNIGAKASAAAQIEVVAVGVGGMIEIESVSPGETREVIVSLRHGLQYSYRQMEATATILRNEPELRSDNNTLQIQLF